MCLCVVLLKKIFEFVLFLNYRTFRGKEGGLFYERARGMPKARRIAVTGNAGSGKSTFCRHLRENGLVVIDLDALSRDAVEPGMPALGEIEAVFGSGVLNADGSLNRSFLRELIISDSHLKKKLEEILHPRIIAIMNTRIDEAFRKGEDAVVVEVPLLFETGMEKLFDFIVVVVCDPAERIRRLSSRDGVSLESAAALISMQMSDELKAGKADYLVLNSGGSEDLVLEAGRLYNYLKS